MAMAWKVSCVMDERMQFLGEVLKEERSFSALCREFGISRKTGYKWVARYRSEGPAGLRDRSRVPHSHPHGVDGELRARVVECKRQHMDWGPKKVRARLRGHHPERRWPAASTIGDILKAEGLVVARRMRRKATPSTQPLAHADGPNAVWCADFKGWFRTGNGARCTPLTISDAFSRYLVRCQGLGGSTGYLVVRPLFDAAFREFGLPKAIRTDNGPPFASVGLGGLSRLSVWWLKLGIIPERIEPGHPEQNGRHERMHRTLREGAISPPASTLRQQQRAFDCFVRSYNEERPHEALGQNPPASIYSPSSRPYPTRLLPTDEYPRGWVIRKVKDSGRIKWQGHELHLSGALTGNYVGFEPLDDATWLVHFMTNPLALFDEKTLRFRPMTKSIKEKIGYRASPVPKPKVLPMFPV